ncbi:MAG: type II secretion system protein [Kiritimatiellae bacterium]|nr:type II secretion system protein [Kiritimatiellia bacterium]
MKRGFTLIELLVVIGMIAVLTGAASSSVMKARKRSQIARAETEAREMTNAILAYENWDDDRSLEKYQTSKSWAKATEDAMQFILGGVQNKQGNVPVLFNAAIVGGEIRDPWGMAYEFMIANAGDASDTDDTVGDGLNTFMYLPNIHRVKPQEVGMP